MPLTYVFSLLFFLAFSIYAILGMFVLTQDYKSILNRVFFLLCISLCIWAVCFSLATSAVKYEDALFWRRASAFGWGSFYGILLHFIMLLTDKINALKRKWIYSILYVPVLVNIYLFCLGDRVSEQYDLINTKAGWINTPTNTLASWYFNIYYISISILGLWMLWLWGRRSVKPRQKSLANILLAAFAVTLVLGTLTDVVANRLIGENIPQLSPVVIFIPIMAILYSVRHYGLMKAQVKKHTDEPGKIISEFNLIKIYDITTMVFFIGGIIIFITRYPVYHTKLIQLISISCCAFIYGITFQIIKRIKKPDRRDAVYIIIVAISVPVITLSFAENASLTVWAIPFIFTIISIVFNRKRVIYWLSASIIFTQVAVWVLVPVKDVQIDWTDHITRIFIYTAVIFLVSYINRVYVQHIIENEEQISFQKMVSYMSADFVNITESNLNEKINNMLKECCVYLKVDRACFFMYSNDIKYLSCIHEWCNEGIKPAYSVVKDLSVDEYKWWTNQIMTNGVIYIPDIDLLPFEAEKEKMLIKSLDVQSLLSILVASKGKALGFLGFDAVRKKHNWKPYHQELLKIFANLLADALIKVKAEQEINQMAYYDTLTGLPNRSLLKNRLEQAIHMANRAEKLIAVIFIDLDFFKSVNDTMGHDSGDELIKLVAERLSMRVRKHDTVSRFGGDEFSIMVTNINKTESIYNIAENVMEVFNEPLKVNCQEFFVTASAGIAVYPIDGEDADTLIKNADMAMYISKEKGKNQFTLCSPDMKEDVLKKMQLTNSLYRALERDELMLYYQPQVDVLTKEIVGIEALLRWKHPEQGMISPVIFIPLAEQTGLINPIGQWVLKTACQKAKELQDKGITPLRMAVNLSVEQFRNPNLVEMVEKTIMETGINAESLELEITESTAVKEAGYITDVLHKLKTLGVIIAIDDFGMEYSSLNRLKILPIDKIKIDMHFVRGIAESNKDEAITKIIIQLAKNLKLKVIAEGVETEKQFEFFREQECDEIQGYYFYKPMPANELEPLLLEQFLKVKKE